MLCGKHVAVEVPAIATIDEAWQLVETSEKTKNIVRCWKIVVMIF